jgi:hypothetical protein
VCAKLSPLTTRLRTSFPKKPGEIVVTLGIAVTGNARPALLKQAARRLVGMPAAHRRPGAHEIGDPHIDEARRTSVN